MGDRQLFQGKCLVSTNGYAWMKSYFDEFPPEVKESLRTSPYNICAACVGDVSYDFMCISGERTTRLLLAIKKIEAVIREEERKNGQQAMV